jgi:hypothetical protein
MRKGFLKGCPNLSEKLILRYLNPSPETAKGHMKRLHHGINSMQTKTTQPPSVSPPIATKLPTPILPGAPYVFPPAAVQPYPIQHQANVRALPHMILDDGDASIANVFCFCAFANPHTSVVYSNLTDKFPFMSFDGSICFLVMYHYESNAILPTPISGLYDLCIFNAYKKNFDKLTSKGFKPKLNVMYNQATKFIKKNLTKEECELQLVKLHNHCMNATKHATQTFKDAFIAALATTDQDFLLQLWDKLTPQVQNTLIMMRASRIDLAMLAYKILNGPYDWNRYPLAPLGCKAVVYKDGDTQGSCVSHGVDGWYLGPLHDHYSSTYIIYLKCKHVKFLGSPKLFLQHCQLPNMIPHQHLQALTNKLTGCSAPASSTPKGKCLLSMLADRIA